MTHAFTRRQFGTLAAGGIALALPSRHVFAQAGEIKLKYGTAFPADHPGTLRIKEAAEAIRKDTGGKVDFQVYPTSQLGSEPDMISQTRAGAIDFMSTAGTNLQTLVPTAGINGVAFAFKDYATVWAAMDGDVGAHVRTALAKVNLHVFDKCLDNGYRNITSATKAINTPDDLKGFKIRVPGIPLWISIFKALGASPTAIPFGELYSALQTKVVDGQENPLTIISIAKLYEVQKYCSMTNHMWDGWWCMTNQKVWDRMPEKARPIIAKHLNQAALDMRADGAKLNASLRPELSAKGLTFNDPKLGPFRERLIASGFYNEWKQKYGEEAWALLEKHTGKLG